MPEKDAEEAAVTQPWLSTRHSQRRRFCHHPSLVREADRGFTLHDRERHYIKRSRQECCAANDVQLSRSPSDFCRKNGFDRPYNLLQVLSWGFFLFDVIFGAVLLVPSFPPVTMIVFASLFGISALGTFIAAWIVTASDPADPLIFEPPASSMIQNLVADEVAQCDLCGPAMLSSKHCRACNKCVSEFDHHCKWLNNCVGRGNYKYFLVLITLVAILSGVIISFCIAAVVSEATDQAVGPRWEESFGWFNAPFFYTALAILGLFNIPLLCLDVQLLALHIYLVWEGLTTFEYITQRVQQPPKEEGEPRRSCCVEWIVIDRKRLKRAREKMRRRISSSEEDNNSSVSINVTALKHPLEILEDNLSSSQMVSATSESCQVPQMSVRQATEETSWTSSQRTVVAAPMGLFSSEEPTVRMGAFDQHPTPSSASSSSPEDHHTPSKRSSSFSVTSSAIEAIGTLPRHSLPSPPVAPNSFEVRVDYFDLRPEAAINETAESEEVVLSRWQLAAAGGADEPSNNLPVPSMHSPRKRRRRRPTLVESPAYSARTKVLPRRDGAQTLHGLPITVYDDDSDSTTPSPRAEAAPPPPDLILPPPATLFSGCAPDCASIVPELLRLMPAAERGIVLDMALSDRSTTQRSARLLHASSYVHRASTTTTIVRVYPKSTRHPHL